ncbi:MAG: VOC family protein [Pigmentiphaga sp.]
MSVTSIRLGYHVTDDVARLSHFYREALGLAPRFADGTRWAEFQAGPSRFALASPAEAPPETRGAMLVFACDTIDALRMNITGHGGVILGERDMGSHGRTLTAADPAGNVFQLYSR